MIEAKVVFILLFLLMGISSFRLKYSNQLRIIEKSFIIFIILCGSIIILQPHLLDKLASPLKIQRGRDLLFYIYMLVSMWALIRNHNRINYITNKINKLTSQVAVQNAKDISEDVN